jgi:hypothetical protein
MPPHHKQGTQDFRKTSAVTAITDRNILSGVAIS